ncbi:Receptor expression-enhancing protein 2 [Geranomyces michiganensis]|nr:Receptor expression-enhancing protein 2 [Geranomyces michiganensis]
MLIPLAKILCYAWGGYSTYKTLSVKATLGKRQRWACYWITLVVLEALEPITDWLLFWVPFYYNAKLVLLLCLCFWTTKATTPIFKRFIHPVFSRKQQKLTYYEKVLQKSLTSARSSAELRFKSITSRLPQIKWTLPPLEPDMIDDETEETESAVETDFTFVETAPSISADEELVKPPSITEVTSSLDIASILDITSSNPKQQTLADLKGNFGAGGKGERCHFSPRNAVKNVPEAVEHEGSAEEMMDMDLMAELLSISELDYSIPEDGGAEMETRSPKGDPDVPILNIDDILNMPGPGRSTDMNRSPPTSSNEADRDLHFTPLHSSGSLEYGSDDDDEVHARTKSSAGSSPYMRRTRLGIVSDNDDDGAERLYQETRNISLPSGGSVTGPSNGNGAVMAPPLAAVGRGSAGGLESGSVSVTPSPPLRKITRPTSVAGRSRTVVSSLGRDQAGALRRSARLKGAGGDRGEPPG